MQKRKKTYYFRAPFRYEDSLALFALFVNRFLEKKLFRLILVWKQAVLRKKQQRVEKPIKCYINWGDLWTYELRYEGDIRGAENVGCWAFIIVLWVAQGSRSGRRGWTIDTCRLSVGAVLRFADASGVVRLKECAVWWWCSETDDGSHLLGVYECKKCNLLPK